MPTKKVIKKVTSKPKKKAAKKAVKKAVKKTAKPATKSVVKKNDKSVEKMKKTKMESPVRKRRECVAELINKRSMTDEQIAAEVNKKFPVKDKIKNLFKAAKVSGIRFHMNRGEMQFPTPSNPFERMIDVEGKIIPVSARPKRKAKVKAEKSKPEAEKKSAVKKLKKVVKKK